MTPRKVAIVLALNALVFGGIGLFAILFPLALANSVGLAASGSAAVTDVRATYGGFEIGLAIFFGICAGSLDYERKKAALLAASLSLSGFAMARLFGLMIDGRAETITVMLLAAELTGSVLNWASFLKMRRDVVP